MNERTDRLAQPLQRTGWVTGQFAWNGSPIRVNLAHVCAIYPVEINDKAGAALAALCFDLPGVNGDGETADYKLLRTEDLLRQLNEEGLGG